MTLIKMLFCRQISFLGASKLSFFVWPWDCDLNIHMTNSRYLSMMDLGRVMWAAEIGLASKMLKRRWFGVLQSSEHSYFKPLKPFQRFEVHTKIIYWDEKYGYFKQDFVDKKGTLYASAILRGILLEKGKRKISVDEFTKIMKEPPTKPAEPQILKDWRVMLESKKQFK